MATPGLTGKALIWENERSDMQSTGIRHAALLLALAVAGCMLKTQGELELADVVDSAPDRPDLWTDADAEADLAEIEIPDTCGNEIIDEGEDCDDGNTISGDGCESDCTWSCESDADCLDGSVCNGNEVCDTEAHVCEFGEPRVDGFVCLADPRSLCLDGGCQISLCGDGFLDTGGGEFCDPVPPDPACVDCRYACDRDDDCGDDGLACNGTEFCDRDAHLCDRRDVPPDGSECDPSASVRMICLSGNCQESICGDAFVDGDGGETCEDGNAVNGDGCENDCTWTCVRNGDCDDGRVCNGAETCDAGAHLCAPGTLPPEGTACASDGLDCTSDACTGGTCAHTPDACDDRLSCTTDTCTEPGPSCANDLADGCLINRICYRTGDLNPGNACEACDPAGSTDGWTPVAEMAPCISGTDAGICCDGVCRVGGNCCDSSSCPPGCSGTARPCSSLSKEECIFQDNCVLSGTGVCTGVITCASLTGVPPEVCTECGCTAGACTSLGLCSCILGTVATACVELRSYAACVYCGCTLGGSFTCTGDHPACGTYDEPMLCSLQLDCAWHEGACDGYQCR